MGIKGKSKIERLGLVNEVLGLKAKGFGSIRIASILNKNHPDANVNVNATNVDNFFKSFGSKVEANKVLANKVDTAIKEQKLATLGNFHKMDDKITELVDEVSKVQNIFIGLNKKTGEPIYIKQKDRRLLKDVLLAIGQLTEMRARLLGQIQQGGTRIYITKIENNYRDLKQIIIDAEGTFPGISNFIETKLVEAVKES